MDNSKKYYVICDNEKTLVRCDSRPGVAENIEEFHGGLGWVPSRYEIKEVVANAVKFNVIDSPAIAIAITTDEQFDEIVTSKIGEFLDDAAFGRD